eukprot:scaffold34975_cov66-Phaeocystis_antarctica.AAC.2
MPTRAASDVAAHAINVCARRCVGRGRIGTAPQIGAAIVCAPVSGQQGKQSQRRSRPHAVGPDRAATTLNVSWVVDVIVVVLNASASRHAGGALWGDGVFSAGRAGTLISLARETCEKTDSASFAGGGCGASSRAKEGFGAQRRLSRCVFWAVVASRATTSALGGELAISVVYLGAKEPRRARNWPIRLVISRFGEELFQRQPYQ